MSSAAMFLAGAKNRLLPASVPFRYFGTAALFQLAFWAMLIFAAEDLPTYRGGAGPVLAAIHLLTLGVMVMVAMGAVYQLLPVATRQPIGWIWPARLSYYIYTPGVAILSLGMLTASPLPLAIGGGLSTLGLVIFALTMADNLRRARGVPVLTAHGWFGLLALLLALGLALVLLFDFAYGFLPDRRQWAASHMLLAGFGFMGLLVLGFSQVLIPMFSLSRALPQNLGWLQLALAVLALSMAVAALLLDLPLLPLAAGLGLGAALTYLRLMLLAHKSRMRKRLGLPFLLIRLAWAMLPFSLLIALGLSLGMPRALPPALFATSLLLGWLLVFLMGVLLRILPFLASMHVAGKDGRPALLSNLTAQRPQFAQVILLIAALGLILLGIAFDSAILVRIGAISGLLSALAFAAFTGFILWQLRP